MKLKKTLRADHTFLQFADEFNNKRYRIQIVSVATARERAFAASSSG
jgi:hypothetical protein